MSSKHIFIIYTGGTVGMKKSSQGYQPAPGFLTETLKQLSEFQHQDLPAYSIYECNPLLDSSDIGPKQWQMIASLITENYKKYDGFIVIHGTDTMAYTASALSFMLQHLDKPVIFTGSQVPLAEAHTDARENLLAAILLAAVDDIPEVCIYFNNQLLRGNRSRKVDSHRASAFTSPNYPPLAEVGTDIQIYQQRLLKKPSAEFNLHALESANIACLTFFPGLHYQQLFDLLEHPPQAIILMTYGAGNAPIHHSVFNDFIKQAIKSNIIIANTTQCLAGGVNMQTYQNGRMLADAGVISTGNMTLEATICKLHYLFTHYPDSVAQRLIQNFRGEIG